MEWENENVLLLMSVVLLGVVLASAARMEVVSFPGEDEEWRF